MIKNFSDQNIIINENKRSIFLAGPTLRNSNFENSWRKTACDILEQHNFEGIVYIPEFSKGDNPFDFLSQAEWERGGLMNASKIVFYIPRKLPDLPGFTTNVEFGMYLAKRPNDVLLASPLNSEKNRYLEWLYKKECPEKNIFRNLDDVLAEAIH